MLKGGAGTCVSEKEIGGCYTTCEDFFENEDFKIFRHRYAYGIPAKEGKYKVLGFKENKYVLEEIKTKQIYLIANTYGELKLSKTKINMNV